VIHSSASSDRSKVKRRPFVHRGRNCFAERAVSLVTEADDYIDDDRERPGISVLREVSDAIPARIHTRRPRKKYQLSPVDADRFSMRSRGRWFLRRSLEISGIGVAGTEEITSQRVASPKGMSKMVENSPKGLSLNNDLFLPAFPVS